MDLRSRREARGLTLEAASELTRISVEHLRALEEGALERLPAGPYREGYLRTYSAALGEEVSVTEASPVRAPERVSWPIQQAVVGGIVAAFLVVGGWQISRLAPRAEQASTIAAAPDQHVTVQAQKEGRIRILVDGEVVVDRRVQPGESLEVAGHDRVEIDLPSVETARVHYNGDAVVPQGRQDAPRRLVFIDDSPGR